MTNDFNHTPCVSTEEPACQARSNSGKRGAYCVMTNPNIKKLFLDCNTDPDAINASLEIGVNSQNNIFIAIEYEGDGMADARVIQLDYATACALLGDLQDILAEFQDNG